MNHWIVIFTPLHKVSKVIFLCCWPFSSEGQKENSGRVEHLSLEMAFVEIYPFRTPFVHVDDFGMIEAE